MNCRIGSCSETFDLFLGVCQANCDTRALWLRLARSSRLKIPSHGMSAGGSTHSCEVVLMSSRDGLVGRIHWFVTRVYSDTYARRNSPKLSEIVLILKVSEKKRIVDSCEDR